MILNRIIDIIYLLVFRCFLPRHLKERDLDIAFLNRCSVRFSFLSYSLNTNIMK